MPKFRKKPVVIEAFQMTPERRWDNSEWPEWLHRAWNTNWGQPGAITTDGIRESSITFGALPIDHPKNRMIILTLEGEHLVDWGDYIIQGVKGELYPCKPDIFEATYELVQSPDPAPIEPVTDRMARWFKFDHLPEHLQATSLIFWDAACQVIATIEPGPERTVALRKLLEAKDAAVRAKLNPGG